MSDFDRKEAARIARQAAQQLKQPHREYSQAEIKNLERTVEHMRAIAKGGKA